MMRSEVAPDHPTVFVQFTLFRDHDDMVRDRLADLVDQLAGSRSWVVGPPEFFEEIHEPRPTRPEEDPEELVGCILEIYSEYEPLKLPADISLLHLEELETMVSALCVFSQITNTGFSVQYDGDDIGEIDQGEVDESSLRDLVDDWRKVHGLPPKYDTDPPSDRPA